MARTEKSGMKNDDKMTKAQAGRMGGLTTLKRYGKTHMSEIGKKGAIRFHKLYKLIPVNLANFAIVNRETNEIVGYMSPAWRM